jgi:spore germination protein KA
MKVVTYDNIKTPLSTSIDENINMLKSLVGSSDDIIFRTLKWELHQTIVVIYTDGLADNKFIQEGIIEKITKKFNETLTPIPTQRAFKILRDNIITIGEINESDKLSDLLKAILSGDTVILIDGQINGLIAGTRGWVDRGVTESTNMSVIRGPKDAFTETLRTNTTLIRRRIKDPSLRIDMKTLGTVTSTDIAVIYLENIVKDDVVKEVHKRLDEINIDSILESGYIEELIQDNRFTPFPLLYSTERPDTVTSAILEGRVAIVVDGTPFVLTAPTLFTEFLQSSEDYYQKSAYSSLIRILRHFSFILTLLTPSVYLAITTFHAEMLPTPFLLSIAANREGIPFSSVVEVILMELTFEVLREAGIRLPKTVGSAISIVGALVIGESAVQAGIISPALVIVVSFTAITSFVIPAYNFSIPLRMLRFVFIFLAATFGLYGILLGIIVLVLHLCNLTSFGVPYMTTYGPFNLEDQKDVYIRFPWNKLKTRPSYSKNKVRQS